MVYMYTYMILRKKKRNDNILNEFDLHEQKRIIEFSILFNASNN